MMRVSDAIGGAAAEVWSSAGLVNEALFHRRP